MGDVTTAAPGTMKSPSTRWRDDMADNPPPSSPPFEGLLCADDALQVASLLAGRWAPRILETLHLAQGPVRFKELQRRVEGISQRELSRQLILFAQHGVVQRTVERLKPLEVHYGLTSAGAKLVTHIEALANYYKSELLTNANMRPSGDQEGTFIVPWPP
jgi:DNA-binding HxlR family transcriptional regulator